MKRQALGFSLIILFGSAMLFGCTGGTKNPETPPAAVEKEQYQCPMCKDQIFDKPGKCPSCDMELVKITKS